MRAVLPPITERVLHGAMLAALVLGIWTAPSVLGASGDALPEAEAILDKFVEASGGQAAYAKLKNRVTKMTIEPVGGGMRMKVTRYAARPNKAYTLIETGAVGKIEQGTNGEVAWEMNPMSGPAIKEGAEKGIILRAGAFDKEVNWRKLYSKAECVGLETIDGRECYKVVVTPNEGEPETRYYDKESNLPAKVELTLEVSMGTFAVELFLSDYREVDGVLLPHKSRRVGFGPEMLINIESVKHNVDLPKDRFKLPEEIQALLDSKKAEQGKSEATRTGEAQTGPK